ncbi:MAG: PKD domain-containing protein, partial [Chitinivibrionales bacterium]|nr:PKD domain-containing protein [Chitinivibrionales bacterium]
TATILVGNTVTLNASVSPTGATNTSVVWSSLDESVATVDASGVVTGIAKGRGHVVATSVNGAKRDTALVSVTIDNDPPVPVLIARPLVGYENAVFKFDGTQSYDTDPDDFVLGYDWDFGDGSPLNFSMNPTHVYVDTGHYTVRFRAMDYNDTRSDWVETELTVKPRYPGVYIYDGFEYPLDSAMKGMQSGYGWAGHSWGGNKGVISNANQPVFGGLAIRGNYLYGGDGARQVDLRGDGSSTIQPLLSEGDGWREYWLGGAADSTMWVSFLVRKEQDNDQNVFFRAHPSIFDCCDNGYVQIGYLGTESNDGGTRYWSVSFDNAVTRSTVPVVAGDDYLLVARFRWTASSTDIDLYVNPASLGGTAPSSADLHVSTASVVRFKTVSLHSGGTNEASFDELRIGTSYAAVTPTEMVAVEGCGLVRTAGVPHLRITPRSHGLTVTGLAPGAQVTILDPAGRIVGRTLVGARSLRLDGIRPGVYLVQVRRGHTGRVDHRTVLVR